MSAAFSGCLTEARERLGTSDVIERWTTPTEAALFDSPVVGRGLVYVSTADAVIGYDRETGAPAREVAAAEARIADASDTLLVWDRLRTQGGHSRLRAVDLADHGIRWRIDRPREMPTVVGERAYVPVAGVYDASRDEYVQSGGVFAADLETGGEAWTFATESGPLVAAGTDELVYVWIIDLDDEDAARPVGVYGVDAADGTERWRFGPGDPWGPTKLAGNTLVVGTDQSTDGSPNVYGVDAADGTERWQFEQTGERAYPMYTTDSDVFVYASGGPSSVLDAITGDVSWTLEAGVFRGVREELVYIQRPDGTIVAADVADGTEVWTSDRSPGDESNSTDRAPSVEQHGETLIVVDGETMVGLDSTSGDERWQFTANRPLLRYRTFHGNEMYVTTDERLYALTVE